ncbi:MAG: xanthine dehydrogenase family protein molybdopterin-binding subunit [Nitrososphaerota archaeon]|nr:xanthine dehydrogenase family protein molybdopterin-binding subunit [Nitrososphaerota archaeon]
MSEVTFEGEEQDPDVRFVKGAGKYVDDVKLDGMLSLHVVRSPYARARVLSVSGGITGNELKATMESVGEDAGGRSAVPFPVLSASYVSYVGQPVAAVLGADRYEAADRAEEVDVQYEPLKPVIDPDKAIEFEPIHPGMKSNLASEVELGKKFELRAPVEVEETFRMTRITPNSLETRGLVASYDGSVLTVYASTQSVFSWREGLAGALGLKEESVRVVQMDTGGGFGSKGGIYPEYVVAAYAAMKTKRPVKWSESRYENLMATDQGRGVRGRMKVYADRKGKLKGLKADILVDIGAYPLGGGGWTPKWIASQLIGPYAVPKAYATAKAVLTNKVNLGPYRGAGRPEAAFFMEKMMDRVADETGLDAAEVRLRNATLRKTTSPLGMEAPPSKKFFMEALRAFHYSSRKKKGKLGLSFFMLIPAAYGGESAKLAVRGGRVKVWMGGSSHGQRHDVFAKTLISGELGIPQDVIDFQHADTAAISGGVGSWGSRTALLGGGALVEASRMLKAKAKKELGKRYSPARLLDGEYEAEAFFKPKGLLNSLGANLATARITKDGSAVVDEVLSFYDVGKVLNPVMLESQVTGGVAQGIGEVMYEQALYSEEGQLLTASIADAGVIHSTEMPKSVVMTGAHRSDLPHGAKGVGESPTIGVPPAATRALEVLLGRRFTTLPIEPEKLWAVRLTGAEERRSR